MPIRGIGAPHIEVRWWDGGLAFTPGFSFSHAEQSGGERHRARGPAPGEAFAGPGETPAERTLPESLRRGAGRMCRADPESLPPFLDEAR